MKQIVDIFHKRTTSFSIHYWYKICAIFFLGVCIYELGQLVIQYYTFFRTCIIFIGLSLGYLGYIFYFSKTQKKNTRLLQKKISFLQKHSYTQKLFHYQENILYSLFLIVFLTFFYSFYTAEAIVFIYSCYIFSGFFLFFALCGKKINPFSDIHIFSFATMLKIGIICMSIYLLLLHSIVSLYGIEEHQGTILFIGGVLFLIGFVFLFTDTYKRGILYFQSRKIRNYMIRNTYNFLSVVFIGLTILLLLGKFGFLQTFQSHFLSFISFSNKPEVVHVEENNFPVENIIQPEVIPERIFERRLISDIYTFNGFSTLGSNGPEVLKLQEALRVLGTYTGEATGDYDLGTKEALTRTLIESCDWPDTTRGIFGPLAQECLNSLEVEIEIVPEQIVSDEVRVISAEAFISN